MLSSVSCGWSSSVWDSSETSLRGIIVSKPSTVSAFPFGSVAVRKNVSSPGIIQTASRTSLSRCDCPQTARSTSNSSSLATLSGSENKVSHGISYRKVSPTITEIWIVCVVATGAIPPALSVRRSPATTFVATSPVALLPETSNSADPMVKVSMIVSPSASISSVTAASIILSTASRSPVPDNAAKAMPWAFSCSLLVEATSSVATTGTVLR